MNNFERLIQLAEDVFAVKNDPDQLDVNQQVIEALEALHPATVSDYADENGPAAWVLMIPCSLRSMNEFLHEKINEKELFEQAKKSLHFETIYLCSALVLEEYRKKGIATNLTLNAIKEIQKTHSIKSLFVWPFSKGGKIAAISIAKQAGLPLFIKEH